VAGGEAARLEAEVRFKEIAAAFETLSDPERRARYDVDMHFREGV
jgi:curved DNA-binding protein CbpA